jgi:membrane dipeptidase
MITLAWIHRNLTSDSVFEVSNAGLSEFGVEVVKEMNRLGMVVDVSHLSSQGFQDVIETSADPVIASHSNARSVCDHPRNLTDDQIKALAEKEGVIGLNLWYPTKERPVTADHLLNNVDKMVDLVGAKHVGIGLDLNENYPNEIYRKVWAGTIFSFDFGDTFPRGLESMSKLPTITKGLVERGYSDEEILNILGQNFLRLFRRVFGR